MMSLHRRGILLAAIAIILAPLAPLLIYPHGTFNSEWNDSLWVIAYDRAYFSSHVSFPAVFNFPAHVGVPRPIFYGPLLYPCLALLSEPFGVNGGVRAACFAAWCVQLFLVMRLSRAVGRSGADALAAAAMACWSVYSLTDLYNRGAISEFFAVTFLLCAILAFALAMLDPKPAWRRGFAVLGSVCVAMAISSHGPTALVGGCELSLLGIGALPLIHRGGQSKRKWASVAGLAMITLVILSPWLYAVSQTSGRLSIQSDSAEFPDAGKWHRLASNDSWSARFKPLPLSDPTAVIDPATPNLNAEWNFPLAVLAAWNALLFLGRRAEGGAKDFAWLAICAAIGAATLLIVSVSPSLQDALPRRFPATIQFPYRLVAHANILLLVLLLALWGARGPAGLPARLCQIDRAVLLAMCLWSLAALGVKLQHTYSSAFSVTGGLPFDSAQTGESLALVPDVYVGQDDFTLFVPEKALPPAVGSGAVKLDAPRGLGPIHEFETAAFNSPAPQWIVTSVMNFPWNRLIVDGRDVPFAEVNNFYFHQAVRVSAGTHTYGYRFDPDSTWVLLSRVSWIVLAAATATALLSGVIPRNVVRHDGTQRLTI